MYTAVMNTDFELDTFRVTIFKDGTRVFTYTFDSLENAHRFISLYLKDDKEQE